MPVKIYRSDMPGIKSSKNDYLALSPGAVSRVMEPDNFDKIKLLREGDVSVFEELFNLHYPALKLNALKYVLASQEAEDIVHNVFLNLWDKREQLDVRESISTYLQASVRNASLNYLRREKVRDNYRASLLVRLSEADPQGSPSDELIRQEDIDEIKEAIDRLPDKCRQIFRMSRFEEMKNQEISDALDISLRTVENQIYRALKILRKKFY
jgi:RNA polymerase sigma-70 factor (ECF subfamily)